ncbi:MAG: protein disulfide isomerase family protein [Sulfurovum sp.]|jgi:thiol-disulfide isomerase/thioredoxin|nr:MAG: Uncharacterised protein [Arcobacter lacus]
MKKLLFVWFFLVSSLFSFEIKELESISQIKKNQDVIIMFSTTYCPWCHRQTRVFNELGFKREDSLQIVKVNDNSEIYKELVKKYPFTIKYFPTSFLINYEEDDLFIIHEFRGYQNEESIVKVLDDEDRF